MLAGLLIHLVVSALLGAIFAIVTRLLWRLPSDFGLPAVSGLVVYLAIPAVVPQLFSIAAPAFIIQHIVYRTLTSLILAKLRPQPYAVADERPLTSAQ